MSIRLMSEVFKHVHGMPSGRRMLLLVLADFANDEGLCWPSIRSLAMNADLGERHVSGELKELAKDGYISIEEHAGKSNHYRIHSRLGVNHSSGVKQGAGVNRSSGVGCTTVHPTPEPQATPTPEPQFTQTIKRTIKEPPVEPSVAVRSPIHQLVDAWAERRGFAPTSWPKASKMAKQLHDAGCSVAELMELYGYLADDPFWADKGFDLGTAVSQLERFRQLNRTPKAKKKTGMEAQMDVIQRVFAQRNGTVPAEDADVYETTGVVR
jgi:hypothetical protein